MHYDAVPMQAHTDTNLKPGDRLIVDWCEMDGRNYHVAVDAASGFIWCLDFRHKGTTEAIKHYKEISNLMGRFGEVHSDNGPAYRSEWDKELAKMAQRPLSPRKPRGSRESCRQGQGHDQEDRP